MSLLAKDRRGSFFVFDAPGNDHIGYGLYDRMLGIMYMLGKLDMLDKQAGK